MQYHELRVLIPAETVDKSLTGYHVMSGVEAAEIVHEAIAGRIAERLVDETAPILVLWERAAPCAASGAY